MSTIRETLLKTKTYSLDDINKIREQTKRETGSIFVKCPKCKFVYEPWEWETCPVCYNKEHYPYLRRNRILKSKI